jgi:D-psicose/D-tagatose/L-ribulose 3-epimerase
MELQNYEKKDLKIKQQFKSFLQKAGKIENKIKFSWSNWGFGLEPIETSLRRLKKYNVNYIEVFGNRFGDDLGYKPKQLKKIITDSGIKISGVCGMVSKESELSSTSPSVRQRCIDYFKRNIELCKVLEGEYLIFHPGAVGRPDKYDDFELERAIDTINIIADYFVDANVKGAIEPVRADEVSTCHTFQEVVDLINSINHRGIKHIAGDVYHMLHGEEHIGETIMNYSDYLINLHMADTNRMALGSGMLNLDIVIMALYLIGYNEKTAFCSAEPLGPGADPYIQMNGPSDPDMLDNLVKDTATYFYKRETLLLEE